MKYLMFSLVVMHTLFSTNVFAGGDGTGAGGPMRPIAYSIDIPGATYLPGLGFKEINPDFALKALEMAQSLQLKNPNSNILESRFFGDVEVVTYKKHMTGDKLRLNTIVLDHEQGMAFMKQSEENNFTY